MKTRRPAEGARSRTHRILYRRPLSRESSAAFPLSKPASRRSPAISRLGLFQHPQRSALHQTGSSSSALLLSWSYTQRSCLLTGLVGGAGHFAPTRYILATSVSLTPNRDDELIACRLESKSLVRPVPRLQPELSLWPGRADGTPDPGMAVSVADCWHCSKLDTIASVSMSSWMFDEEESQKRIRRSDTCQRQERNGQAAHGSVRTRRRNKSSRWAKGAG